VDLESTHGFEKRKKEQIELALHPENQAVETSGLGSIQLIHEALPEVNFKDIEINVPFFEVPGKETKKSRPFFVSSMTAGHEDSLGLNLRLAKACEERNWILGVGSQRRQLTDASASDEWRRIRSETPNLRMMGNLGLAQVIKTNSRDVIRLIESLGAEAMIIHLNPLQECLQPEGTPQFSGGLEAIKRLVEEINVPVVVKETGCGFSAKTLQRLTEIGVAVVDLSGLGGTHWGRIEGKRSKKGTLLQKASETFADWGITTADSLIQALEINPGYSIWASGGVRTGLDGAKYLAMGASAVGFAHPALQAALKSGDHVRQWMEQMEFELKVALFCTGCRNIKELQDKNRETHTYRL